MPVEMVRTIFISLCVTMKGEDFLDVQTCQVLFKSPAMIFRTEPIDAIMTYSDINQATVRKASL